MEPRRQLRRNRRLRDRRRAIPLTQEELAARLGVSALTVRRWEAGRQPQPIHVRKLCDELHASASELGLAPSTGAGPYPRPMRGMREHQSDPVLMDVAERPELAAVGDMVEWLAEAVGMAKTEILREVSTRLPSAAAIAPPAPIPRSQRADALVAYYGERELARVGLHPYTVDVEGTRLTFSMVIRPAWYHCSVQLINPVVPSSVPDEHCTLIAAPSATPSFTSTEALRLALDRLAVAAVGSRTQAGPVMVNKPLYRLVDIELNRTRMDAKFALDWFANFALSYDLLAHELVEALTVSPNPRRLRLPVRDTLLGSADVLADISGRLCVGGLGCLFAIARPASWAHPADFLFVVQKRSPRVLNMPGSLSVIPRAFHQHMMDAQDEVGIGVTVARELEEEMFGRTDVDEGRGRTLALNMQSPDRQSAPMRWLAENGVYAAECTGCGINLATGEYWFTCLACVPNEQFWAKHGSACLPNWEAADVQIYSTADTEGLSRLILDERWSSESLMALLEGLWRLAERYPDRVSLPTIEILPR